MMEMKKIYLDNASTAYPKAPGTAQSMYDYIEQVGCNINRGGYGDAYAVAKTVLETREKLCSLFAFEEPRNVVFTANVTLALNIVIKGFFQQGNHILVSAMEHNAVMRPVVQLAEQGVITFDRIPCRADGSLLLEEAKLLLRSNTKAVVMTHASNVCGTIMPFLAIGDFCKTHNLRFIADCAQTAGVFPIHMKEMHIDALCFTGHKGLLGPQGIGGFLISDAFVHEVTPLISGGTGSFSDMETVPKLMPDRFEAGTPNLPGIYGLSAALDYLRNTGIDTIRLREQALSLRFTRGVEHIDGVRIIGEKDCTKKAAIVSLDFVGRDNAEAAYFLESKYGLLTRCGLHCAPNAHKTLKTFPQGTVRFSVGHQNTEQEIDIAIAAIKQFTQEICQ